MLISPRDCIWCKCWLPKILLIVTGSLPLFNSYAFIPTAETSLLWLQSYSFGQQKSGLLRQAVTSLVIIRMLTTQALWAEDWTNSEWKRQSNFYHCLCLFHKLIIHHWTLNEKKNSHSDTSKYFCVLGL